MAVRRRARVPILVYCEGVHDAIFMRHLWEVYSDSNVRNSFDIKTGAGGSPLSIVEKARRVVGAYEARFVKFDNDRGEKELQAALSQPNDVRCCVCTPCIEATLLEILEGKSYSNRPSQWCKSRFHSRYIAEVDRGRIHTYRQLFPRDVLEEARQRMPQLERMIRIFEHGEKLKDDL